MRDVTPRWYLLAVTLLLLAIRPAAADDPIRGVFVNTGDTKAVIDRAIDAAVAKMNFLTASIARGRLPYRRHSKCSPGPHVYMSMNTVYRFSGHGTS